MDLLITAAQVAAIAFRAPDFITPDAIGEATVLAAEHKFIRPVLGDALCDALQRGKYSELLTEYVQPPLALYVKMLMMPTLAVQTGAAGVVEVNSRNLARAADAKTRAAVRRLRGDAAALVARAVKHIETDPAAYPEYDPAANIMNSVSTGGGIVIRVKSEKVKSEE
jgi:hypothetical protein